MIKATCSPCIKALIVINLLIFQTIVVSGQSFARFVNPFIGTSNYGATHPGAVVPQGMVSVVPFNVTGSSANKFDKDARWWSAPYASENTFFSGYSHVNLSGVGCPDLGVIMLMPTSGKLTARISDYGSAMSRQKASAGYYSCFLDKYQILTEVSATQRTGISRFTYPAGEANIMIDLGNGLTNESGAHIRVLNNHEVEGWRMTGNFCYQGNSERPVYFYARISKPAKEFGVWKKMPELKVEGNWSATNNNFKFYKNYTEPMAGDSIGAWFSYQMGEGEMITVQLGISYVSIENARLNLQAEQPVADFDKVWKNAQNEWETVLSKIQVEGGTDDEKTIFYTALYHMNLHPNILNDVNGEYPLMESAGTGKLSSGNRYTVFSLWDTYRNYHPFMSLVYPEIQTAMVNSMVEMYKESDWLPKWELNSRETYTMNGDPALPVITDTYLRGLTGFDVQTAYEAMVKSATTPEKENKIRVSNDFYLTNGYVPFLEPFDNSVSVALEYYIADWNLGQLAKALGKTEDYKRFNAQSLRYVNYYDAEQYGVFRPKLPNGSFLSNFDPMQGKNFEPVHGFHEGTAWNYAFCVQHDIPGLIRLSGGKDKFLDKLNTVFSDSLYDMTNEPDIHYPYLYNYLKGEEWRAQQEVSSLINTWFSNKPGGLPGNDDCGTMSAWLAFSMMGLYPVCPGDMNFAIVKPVFEKVTIHLDSRYYPGKQFEISRNGTANGRYIKGLMLNEKKYSSYFVPHQTIVAGGKLEILND